MPGGDVTAAAAPSSALAVGLVGKLPAHGDFVRRGGPAAVLAMLDSWLDAELGAAVAGGLAPDEAVAALDGVRCGFALPGGGGGGDAGGAGGFVLAGIVASHDRVGRRFPVLATLTGAGAGLDAEGWAAAAVAALAAVRDAAGDADAALAAVAAIPLAATPDATTPDATTPDAAPADAAPATGWWRAGGRVAEGGLPTGAAFRAMLAGDRA